MIDPDKFNDPANLYSLLNDEQKNLCERHMTLSLRIKLLKELKEAYSPIDFDKLGFDKDPFGMKGVTVDKENSNPPVEEMINEWINEIEKELNEIRPKITEIYQDLFVGTLINSYKLVFNEKTIASIRGEYNEKLFREFVKMNPGTHVTDDTMPFILTIVNGYTEFLFNTFGKKEEKTE